MLTAHFSKRKTAIRLKIVAAGNAGCNMLDRLALSTGANLECAALNSDAANLNACVASEKILLGTQTTGGLGAGGDPEHALAAFEESRESALAVLEDADAFLFLGGLGGGTAGVVIAELASAAKSRGIPSLAAVTLPFDFEGARKARQASEALEHIRQNCTLTAAFPNEGMNTLPSASARLAMAFAAADDLLAGLAGAISRMLSATGPMEITAGDLFGLLGGGCRTWAAHASATGSNRVAESLARLWKSPLLPVGEPVEKATHILLHVASGEELTFSEVAAVLQGVRREIGDEALLHLGICTGHLPPTELAITLLGVEKPRAAPARHPASSRTASARREAAPAPVPELFSDELPTEEASVGIPTRDERHTMPPSEEIAPSPELGEEIGIEQVSASEQTEATVSPEECPAELFPPPPAPHPPAASPARKGASRPKQEVLPLEVAVRGRFEKSEPTIVEGEDLDVPTYMRWKIRIKS